MKIALFALTFLAGPAWAIDANECIKDASSQYGSGLKNICNQQLIVTYCFSSGGCDAPRGQGREGHEIRPGAILVIGPPGKNFSYHACVWPMFPDGERGCTKK